MIGKEKGCSVDVRNNHRYTKGFEEIVTNTIDDEYRDVYALEITSGALFDDVRLNISHPAIEEGEDRDNLV